MGNEPGRLRHRLTLALVAAALVGVGGVVGILANAGTQTNETGRSPPTAAQTASRRRLTRTWLPVRTIFPSSRVRNAMATGAAAVFRRTCPR